MGSNAVLPSRLPLLLFSSAEEDDRLCRSDLGAAMKLSRIVSFTLQLAKLNKEEGGLADSAAKAGEGGEELGKSERKTFLLSDSQR